MDHTVFGKTRNTAIDRFWAGFFVFRYCVTIPGNGHDGYDYNVIKNFNGIKIIRWIAIYNISPDIVSE